MMRNDERLNPSPSRQRGAYAQDMSWSARYAYWSAAERVGPPLSRRVQIVDTAAR